MKLSAITMVKDEADVIHRTIDHLIGQGVDEILIYENASTDGTWEILRDLRDGDALDRIHVFSDPEIGYYQARKMTALAVAAHARGADWIIPFDADELWTAPGGLHAYLELDSFAEYGVVAFPNFNHYRTSLDPGGHPFDAMGWRSPDPLPLPKVAFRACAGARLEAGNHGVSGVRGRFCWDDSDARIHHYPYRSPEQFISKARNGSAAYAATDLPRSTGQHWREWGEALETHGEAGLRSWFGAFEYDDPVAEGLIYDPVSP